MNDKLELERMSEWGATVGQIEHRAIELGLRDRDEPTADAEWWSKHGGCDTCKPDSWPCATCDSTEHNTSQHGTGFSAEQHEWQQLMPEPMRIRPERS